MSTASFVFSAFKELLSISPRNMAIVGDSVPIPKFKTQDINDLLNEFMIYNRGKSALTHINHDVIIVGDIHGSLDDLLRIFAFNGLPPDQKYLFLGDYVDHGDYSIECVLLLFSLSILFPQHVILLRGNHELPEVNKNHGFYSEIMDIYNDESLYNLFNSAFEYLGLCAILRGKYFCVHGGISVHLRSLAVVESILLPIMQITPLIEDMIWSDPVPDEIWYGKNERGLGKTFGKLATKRFLTDHNFLGIIRAHQCVMGGTTLHQDGLVMTIFSASDYEKTDNRSGYLVSTDKLSPYSIEPLPHEIRRKDAFTFDASKDENPTHASMKPKIMLTSLSSNVVQTRRKSRSFVTAGVNPNIGNIGKTHVRSILPHAKVYAH